MKLRSSSAAATATYGAALAGVLRPGDVLVLTGDLGAGKTQLTRGIAEGLGLADRVTSPTFALVHHYDHGPTPMVHVDAWRLGDAAQLEDLGIEDVLDPEAVTVVEWGDIVALALPADRLVVHIALGLGTDDRVLDVVALGASWRERVDALAQAAATLEPGV